MRQPPVRIRSKHHQVISRLASQRGESFSDTLHLVILHGVKALMGAGIPRETSAPVPARSLGIPAPKEAAPNISSRVVRRPATANDLDKIMGEMTAAMTLEERRARGIWVEGDPPLPDEPEAPAPARRRHPTDGIDYGPDLGHLRGAGDVSRAAGRHVDSWDMGETEDPDGVGD